MKAAHLIGGVAVAVGLLMARAGWADVACDADPLPEPDSAYREYIAEVHRELGIPEDYAARTGMRLQRDNRDYLEKAWPTQGGQGFRLTPEANQAWLRMRADAGQDGIELILLSAYRSVFTQKRIIQGHLDNDREISDILRLNAAPGHSEHHTGDAMDLNTPGVDPLDPAFADTPAYAWLRENAWRYCFELSYPPGNEHGVAFEPWHWRFIRSD